MAVPETFKKYGFNIAEFFNAATEDDETEARNIVKNWCKIIQEKILTPYDNYTVTKANTAASIVKDHKDTKNTVAETIGDLYTEALTPEILSDNATLASLVHKIDDLKKFVLGQIEANAARQANIENSQVVSKRQLQQEYMQVRKDIVEVVKPFLGDINFETLLPRRTGPASDKTNSQSQIPFYAWEFEIDGESLEPGESWATIAQMLDVSLVNPKTLKFMDFTDMLEETLGIKFDKTHTEDFFEGTLNGHKIVAWRIM